MTVDIDYYVNSMLMHIDKANKTDTVMVGYICSGAIGYAYMRGDIDVTKLLALNETVFERCNERLKIIDSSVVMQ